MTEYVRHGIQFVEVDKVNSELRVVGSDDAGIFLWAAQWLDEHRGFIVNAARFEATPGPGDEADLTATLVISLDHAGDLPDGREPGRLGPWTHGVPPMPAPAVTALSRRPR
jgi:hypothetical protein